MAGKRYVVAQAGLGMRGKVHVDGILGNADRLELAAVCDLQDGPIGWARDERGITRAYKDAERMLDEVRPDVFVFVTRPDVRLEMVRLAAKYGVRGLAFEKPMATSLRDAREMTRICEAEGIKAVVSHQQKYLTSLQRLKAAVDSGAIGEVDQINFSAASNMSGIGTHFMDYAMWVNGGRRVKWAVGHIHGKKGLSTWGHHPAADYVMGQAEFEGGVRLFLECGTSSRRRMAANRGSFDNRLSVYGTEGFAWAETDGAFCICSGGVTERGQDASFLEQERNLQTLYFKDLADWLDDGSKAHPCNIGISYHGYEVLEGICVSSLERRPVEFPVDPEAMPDVLEKIAELL